MRLFAFLLGQRNTYTGLVPEAAAPATYQPRIIVQLERERTGQSALILLSVPTGHQVRERTAIRQPGQIKPGQSVWRDMEGKT